MDNISRNCCSRQKGVILPSFKVIWPRSRSQFMNNTISGHKLLWVTLMGMILHTIVVHDPRVSLWQVSGP